MPMKSLPTWVPFLALSLLFFLVSAGTFSSLGVVLPAMVSEMKWSWTEAGLGYTLLGVACGLSSLAPAVLIRKIGVRGAIAAGALLCGVGFAGLALTHSIGLYLVSEVLIGVGFSLTTTVPGVHVITALFEKRSTMLGAYFTIGGLGQVAGPLMYVAINGATHQWRYYWWVFVVASAVLGGFAALTTSARQDAIDPAADQPPVQVGPADLLKGLQDWTVRHALRTPQFYVIVGAYTMYLLINTTAHGFAVEHLRERGIDPKYAAGMLSLEALIGAIVAVVGGVVGEKVSPKSLMSVALGALVIGMAALAYAHGYGLMLVYALGIGIGYGLSFIASTMLLLNYFGKRANLELFSIMSLISTLAAIGPAVGGWARDTLGGFSGVFLLCALATLLMLVANLFLAPPDLARMQARSRREPEARLAPAPRPGVSVEVAPGGPAPGLLVLGGRLVTQDAGRRSLDNYGVAATGGVISEIAPSTELKARWPHVPVLDASDAVVIPGLVDAHQHLTGDPLVRSLIPDDITSDQAIFDWATPLHAALTPDDDELGATLTAVECLRYGTTTLIEAGTVAHPDRVAAGMLAVGVRGGVGCWGWDTPGLPFSSPAAEVLARQEAVVRAFPKGGQVEGWVTLVGHDLASDTLLEGAADLARRYACGLTFHLSPTEADVAGYMGRRGLRPVAHLQALGVLGEHLLLAHAVWIDEAELELLLETRTAIAYCPWTYLRLAQGVTRAGRHGEFARRGGRLALGCDSVNAGDLADVHRAAALAVGLARDAAMSPGFATAAHGLDWGDLRGGRKPWGLGDRVGSIEIGKRADMVVHETRSPAWRPAGRSDLNLIWGTDGRTVRDVVVEGRIVVRDGASTQIDEAELAAKAREAQAALLSRAGF